MRTTYYVETYLRQSCGDVKVSDLAYDSLADMGAAMVKWAEQAAAKGDDSYVKCRTVVHSGRSAVTM